MSRTTFQTLARLAAATAVACTTGHALAQPTTLRFVGNNEPKVLDPQSISNLQTRNFGYLVYDTLFSQDAKGIPRPQMVEKYTSSPDGRQWTFTLRPGLKFHDGAEVTAADCVASMERWADFDNSGRAMTEAGASWSAVDSHTIRLTLRETFGPVLESISKVSSFPAVIMPARVVKAAGRTPVTETTGSGPFKFKRDEWVPGSRLVFVRNTDYVGRSEPASFLAGNKQGQVDRIEWRLLPDATSAASALRAGEVDMLELVAPDQLAALRADPDVRVITAGSYQGGLVMNHVQPPFNNPKVRQALLQAVNQEKFIAAMGFPAEMRMKFCGSFFMCGSPNETSAGSEPYRQADVAKAKKMLAESGYKGEKVVLMIPATGVTNGAGAVALQTMKQIGLNVEAQTMEWGSLITRRASKEPIEKNGWSAYATYGVASTSDSPMNNYLLGASCGNSMPGWPCDKQLDELRTAWIKESDLAKRKVILDKFHQQAYESVTYIPFGQFTGAFAARKQLKNAEKIIADVPTLWMLAK